MLQGARGLCLTRYPKNRRFHEQFQNVAVWRYWEGARRLPGKRGGAIAVGSIPDGWIWAIPLSDGQMSVGVVMQRDAFNAQRKKSSLEEFYADALEQSDLIRQMTCCGTPSVRSARGTGLLV